MPTLIKDGRVVTDDWTLLETVPDGGAPPHSIVPAAYAVTNAAKLFAGSSEFGVWVQGDSEPEDIAPLLDRLPLVAIRFAAVNDGRGLSLAVLLRTRYRYTGELRAIGEVLEDVMNYMRRCGFDSYQLPDGHDPQVALRAMRSLSDFYQGSVIDPRPAFRRVARGGR
jgi:uncharacterized protein (DUF934 family)